MRKALAVEKGAETLWRHVGAAVRSALHYTTDTAERDYSIQGVFEAVSSSIC
jgi:hypothetical protein